MEKIGLNEFLEKYRKPENDWRFDLFSILCKKCGSDMVEYDGKLEGESGYYGEFDVHETNVIKCHGCGNAFTIDKTESGGGGYCSHDD